MLFEWIFAVRPYLEVLPLKTKPMQYNIVVNKGIPVEQSCLGSVIRQSWVWPCLACKEIKPVNPKGIQSWIFTGRTDVEAEAPILWSMILSLDAKNWFIGKDPDAEKDWRQEGKGMTEDEMGRWHHQLDEHEFEQALGVGDGQGSLLCCSPWGLKESNMTEWQNWTDTKKLILIIDYSF